MSDIVDKIVSSEGRNELIAHIRAKHLGVLIVQGSGKSVAGRAQEFARALDDIRFRTRIGIALHFEPGTLSDEDFAVFKRYATHTIDLDKEQG
jgi:hypothetical protein